MATNHTEQLTSAIQQGWSAETTSSPDEWDAEHRPSRGQCVPTALVVQDHLGGSLERLATEFNGTRETHYRNVGDDGTITDLTRDQYPTDQDFIPAPVDGDLREYVLGNENTRRRYLLLSETVAKLLSLE
ncbi:MAG: hypothetical protein ABIP74_01280 [Candidatus Saccharimonas sp.]